MQRRRSLPRRSNGPAGVDGGALPPLAAAMAMRLATATEDGELQRSASHLRAVARHAQPTKPMKQTPLGPTSSAPKQSSRALVQLKPLDRLPTTSFGRSNNNYRDEGEEDRVLAEIWRVATTTAKQHSDKALRSAPTMESNNDAHDRTRQAPKPQDNDEPSSSTNGTTLARYRRLVGMHARRTLVRILADAAARVAQTRRETRSGIRIQRLARRFLGRRRRGRVRYEQVVATETLQGWWRVLLAMRRLQLLRREEQARQRLVRHRAAAARTIQQCLRHHVLVGRAFTQRLVELNELRRRYVEMRSRRVVARAMLAWWRRKKKRESSCSLDCVHVGEWECNATLVSQQENAASAYPSPDDGHGAVEYEVETLWNITTGGLAGPPEPLGWHAPIVDTISTSSNRSSDPSLEFGFRQTASTLSNPKPACTKRAELDLGSAWSSSSTSSGEHLTEEVAVVGTGCLTALPKGAGESSVSSVVTLATGAETESLSQPEAVDSITTPLPSVITIVNILSHSAATSNATAQEADGAKATGLRKFAMRRATRLIAHFLSSRCLPLARCRIAVIHSAATRIQQLIRKRLARQEAGFRRQLHIISLRSELQAHWLASEAQLLATVFDSDHVEDDVDVEAGLHDEDDDEGLVFADGDDDHNEPWIAGPTWAEVLPTRCGRIPRDLRVDFTRGGPADRRAPSLGLWKWSWTSERWEPRRDLFQQLHTRQEHLDP